MPAIHLALDDAHGDSAVIEYIDGKAQRVAQPRSHRRDVQRYLQPRAVVSPPDPGKPNVSQTIWPTVADLTNKRYVFESTSSPNIAWVELGQVNFGEGAPAGKLDLIGDNALEGDLAGTSPLVSTELIP